MKRFVDLRDQDIGWRFAWWDTCVDRFETHSGFQAWDTWDDFVESFEGSPDQLERYKGLTSPWAFEPIPEDTED
jgi:hypothetical protein